MVYQPGDRQPVTLHIEHLNGSHHVAASRFIHPANGRDNCRLSRRDDRRLTVGVAVGYDLVNRGGSHGLLGWLTGGSRGLLGRLTGESRFWHKGGQRSCLLY